MYRVKFQQKGDLEVDFEVSGPNPDFVNKEVNVLWEFLFPPPKATDSIPANRRLVKRSWYQAWEAKAIAKPIGNPIITPAVYCPDCYEDSYRFLGHSGVHWIYKTKNRKHRKGLKR
jgi:hypothetical protein